MFESVATACAGLFAGAALYITLVQQPAAREDRSPPRTGRSPFERTVSTRSAAIR